ncbi:distal tail protein Dit [Sutcliffiella halmapala]|uniref:distal tail protein Dit n=1 Tax=Sutcliffiella halmapala TaxID=79882 RepID=UPI000994A2E7|nr:distal tail protein Dit [Sutcliffiella halmapala]
MRIYFNGVTKSYVRALRGIERPSWAPIEHEIIEVTGRSGGITTAKKKLVRVIYVPIEVRGVDSFNLQKAKEDLAAWLIKDNPCPLVFPDEPDRVYFAEVTGELNLEEILERGKGILTFICTDPYKYGTTNNYEKPATTGDVNTLVMRNPGTVESYPEFTFIAKKQMTFLDIIAEDAYMRIGRPVSVEETIVNPAELILEDSMSTLVGWTTASQIDGGVRAGSFQANSEGFSVSSFGSGSNWHGPSLQKSISQTLKNFQVEMVCSIYSNSVRDVGRIELYLVDPSGNHIGKLSMKDVLQGDIRNDTEVRIGQLVTGTYLLNGTPEDNLWRSFYGLLRLTRIDGVWSAYVAKIDGKHVGPMQATHIDTLINTDLAALQVHIGVNGTASPSVMKIHKLKVFKRNVITENVVPIIANAGDEITINHKTNEIRINGEDMKKRKDFGGRFFPLKPGDNALVISPGDAVDINSKVRGAYH